MIKKLYLFGIIITVASMIVFAGCGQKYNAPKAIVGEWTCHEFASDEMTDTSFYALTIKEDGTFSLYDYASGNPGISGKMYCDDTGNLGIINIECDETDFDPPLCWMLPQPNSPLNFTADALYSTFPKTYMFPRRSDPFGKKGPPADSGQQYPKT